MTTPASAEPTAEQLAQANAMLAEWHDLPADYDMSFHPLTTTIARALASQRAEVVARYEALADRLQMEGEETESLMRSPDVTDEERWRFDAEAGTWFTSARMIRDVDKRIREAAPK